MNTYTFNLGLLAAIFESDEIPIPPPSGSRIVTEDGFVLTKEGGGALLVE